MLNHLKKLPAILALRSSK